MRSGIRVVNLVLLAAVILLLSSSSAAQSLTPCMDQVRISMDRDVFLFTRKNVRPPYTATTKQTFQQTLPDGNTIHWTIETVQARDESGRNMRQHIQGCDADDASQPQLRIDTSVSDPVARTFINWNTGPGSVALVSLQQQQAPVRPPDLKDVPRIPWTPHRPQITHEDLGTRTIAGMEANGIRQTETIPAGLEGNDMPFKVVHETWTNRENHATLMAIDDDPRTGRHTWEVESLTIGSPDPALFTPPAGYKVWDQSPQPQTTTDAKQ